jgi:hypothetical protein
MSKLPTFTNDQEAAAWFATHDTSPYMNQLEEVAQAYRQGTNLVRLDPDVARVFKDAATVNSALRMLAQIAQEHVSKQGEG